MDLSNASAINKAILSIQRKGKKLDEEIQVVGVACLKHIVDHSDTTLLNKLVLALPKGARKTAFVAWALEFGSVRILDRSNPADEVQIARGDTFKYLRDKVTDLDGAEGAKWYDFKPEPDVLTEFDMNKAVGQLMKQFTKAVKANAEVKGVEDAKKQLRALLQSLEVQGEKLDEAA